MGTRIEQIWWFILGLSLVIIGILLLFFSLPEGVSQVSAHETEAFGYESTYLGPYQLEEGMYYVWIEDYFPGFDDGEEFSVEVITEGGEGPQRLIPNEYTTRSFDGVECEKIIGFKLDEGEWTFRIRTLDDTTRGDEINIFIIDTAYPSMSLILAIGLVILFCGMIFIVLSLWKGRKDDG